MKQFHDDGPDPKGDFICWTLAKQFNGGWWDEPERWVVTPMLSETAKMWIQPHKYGSGANRRDKNLIIGRFDTRQEAEAARRVALEAFHDVKQRMDAVKREMEEACRPFNDRLKQLAAERADRLAEAVAQK